VVGVSGAEQSAIGDPSGSSFAGAEQPGLEDLSGSPFAGDISGAEQSTGDIVGSGGRDVWISSDVIGVGVDIEIEIEIEIEVVVVVVVVGVNVNVDANVDFVCLFLLWLQ
jgi:hypothetical protein